MRISDWSSDVCSSVLLGLRELDERNLPRPATPGLAVEVELVHHDQPDVGAVAPPERDVGEDLGRAADDGGVAVDREAGRVSCRESGCRLVLISVVAVSFKNTQK